MIGFTHTHTHTHTRTQPRASGSATPVAVSFSSRRLLISVCACSALLHEVISEQYLSEKSQQQTLKTSGDSDSKHISCTCSRSACVVLPDRSWRSGVKARKDERSVGSAKKERGRLVFPSVLFSRCFHWVLPPRDDDALLSWRRT